VEKEWEGSENGEWNRRNQLATGQDREEGVWVRKVMTEQGKRHRSERTLGGSMVRLGDELDFWGGGEG
jgi:hypothetical protein